MSLVQEGFSSGLLPFSLPLIVFVFLKEGLLRLPLASGPLCSLGRRPRALESPASTS